MKKSIVYPLIMAFVFLGACTGDKNDPNSRASSDQASRNISEASPDGIRTEISANNDIFDGGTLEKIYNERAYRSIWRDGETLFGFYNSLREADKEGLDPNDYHREEI